MEKSYFKEYSESQNDALKRNLLRLRDQFVAEQEKYDSEEVRKKLASVEEKLKEFEGDKGQE